MKVSAVFIFAAVALLGECAKLPKDSKNSNTDKVVSKVTETKAATTKQDAVKTTKQNKAEHGKKVVSKSSKDDSKKAGHSTIKANTSVKPHAQRNGKIGPKVTAKQIVENKRPRSPKSVIVQQRDDTGQRDAIVNSHIASNPILDSLYEQRYEALQKVSSINDQISSLLNRKPGVGASESSAFMRPGAFDSGTYHVQGGTMFLGPANAGDIVGMEDAKKRDESSSGRQKNGAIPDASSASPLDSSQSDSTAPVDMPQPLDEEFFSPEANAANDEQQNLNLTGKEDMDILAAMDDPLG